MTLFYNFLEIVPKNNIPLSRSHKGVPKSAEIIPIEPMG